MDAGDQESKAPVPTAAIENECPSRKSPARRQTRWDQVDREAKRIYFPTTKNGEASVSSKFIGHMEEWIETAWENHERYWPDCPYVIQRDGKPVCDPRKAWTRACKAVGLSGLWPHDLRRSAVRNLDRSGVSPKIATAISGHKTRSVYERYNIVADRDLEEAARKVDHSIQTEKKSSRQMSLWSGPRK